MAIFLSEVHNKAFDNVTKLLYLQKACTGKASKTLGSWKPVAESYETAWNVLREKYEDDYLVIQGLVGQIFNIRTYDKETYDALNTVYEDVNHAMRQLATITSSNSVILDQLLIHLSCQKLPSQTLDAWERHRSTGDEPIPKLTEFHKFLNTRARGRIQKEMKDTTPSEKHQEKRSDFRREFTNNNRFKPYSRPDHFNQNRNWGQGNNNSKVVAEQGRTRCYMTMSMLLASGTPISKL